MSISEYAIRHAVSRAVAALTVQAIEEELGSHR